MSKFPNVSDLLGLKFKFREPKHEYVGLEGIIIGEKWPNTAVMAITKGNAENEWDLESSRDLDIIQIKNIKKYAAYKCLFVPMNCIGEHVDDDFSDEGECTMIKKNSEFKIGDKVAFKYDMLDEDGEEAEGIIILMLENSLALIKVTGGNTSGAWCLDASTAADDYDITPQLFKEYKGSLCCYKVTDVLKKLEEEEEVDMGAVEHNNANYFDAHYLSEHQPIETMQSNMSPEAFKGFLRGNIIKYACRLGRKDDERVEATKIKRYAKWLLDAVDGKTIDPRKG